MAPGGNPERRSEIPKRVTATTIKRTLAIGALAILVMTTAMATQPRSDSLLIAVSEEVARDLAGNGLWYAIGQIKECLTTRVTHDHRPLRPRV